MPQRALARNEAVMASLAKNAPKGRRAVATRVRTRASKADKSVDLGRSLKEIRSQIKGALQCGALQCRDIPKLDPDFPGLPHRTDFRTLASCLNISIKRPIDDGEGFAIPGHLTRDEEDPIIAMYLAKVLAIRLGITNTSPSGSDARNSNVFRIAAALYCDPDEFQELKELRSSTTFENLYNAPNEIAKAAALD